MKRNVLTAPVLKTVRWGLMCLALCLTSMPANAADEMANTLVYAGENEDTINPLLNNHQELPTIIFSGLMKYDAKGQPVPELAESFTYDKGTHTYAFKLRDGVKWHDGKPLTVEDILFTYEALTKDKTLASSITSNYEDIKSITAPDAQTVIFTLSKPNAAMLDNFTIGILPKHLFAGKDINTAPANQHPVGTGRYKFVEWDTAGGMIILEKNKDYYGKVPNIDRIVYKTVAVESTKALMLQSGEADLAWLNAKYADTFRGKDGYKKAMPEFPGYCGPSDPQTPVMRVTAVTHRLHPIMQTTIGPSEEHVNLAGIPTEASILGLVERAMPGRVRNVYAASCGGGKFMAVLQFRKATIADEGRQRQAALLAFSAFPELKHVFLVDDDVDPFDMSDVLWAMTTRYQGNLDTVFLPGVRGHVLDPTQSPLYDARIPARGVGCKAIFDCTVPFDQKERFQRAPFMEVDPGKFLI